MTLGHLQGVHENTHPTGDQRIRKLLEEQKKRLVKEENPEADQKPEDDS
jgi:hypothetical protein